MIFGSYFAYGFDKSVESHMTQAFKHVGAAASATDEKAIAHHAELALSHARTADEHLDTSIKSLEEVIERTRLARTDLAI